MQVKSFEQAIDELNRWGMSHALAVLYGRDFDEVDKALGSAVAEIPGDGREMRAKGVKAAARFLQSHGHEILDTDYGSEGGVAVISDDGNGGIHFVEVATREGDGTGFAETVSSDEKRHRFECVAESFLRRCERVGVALHFDSIQLATTAPDRAFVRWHKDFLNGFLQGGE